jgi:tetratricopeptide (TPR) repeat protein
MTISREANTQNNEAKLEPLTKENFLHFYQTLKNIAETHQGNTRSIAEQVLKSYLAHIKNTLHQNTDAFSKANTIIMQIDILANQQAFSGKLDSRILDAIKKDLSVQGKDLAALVSEEYHDEFIEDLVNMQATESRLMPSMIPIHIETGRSLEEMKSVGSPLQRAIPKINGLIAQCPALDKNHHYVALIEKLTEAIHELTQVFDLLPSAQKPFLFQYIEQLAYSYNALATQYQKEQDFPKAVASLRFAISLIKEARATHGLQSKVALVTHSHDLAHMLGLQGVYARSQKQFALSSQCFNEAIGVIATLSDEPNDVDTQNSALMRHNIAVTEFSLGHHLSMTGDHLGAIKKIIQAIELLKSLREIRPSVAANLIEYRRMLAHIREKHVDTLLDAGEVHCRLQMQSKGEAADKAFLASLECYKSAVDFLMPIKSKMLGNAESRLIISQTMLNSIVKKFNQAHPELNFSQSSAGGYKDATNIILYLRKKIEGVKSTHLFHNPFLLPQEIIFFGRANKANYAKLKDAMIAHAELRSPGNR